MTEEVVNQYCDEKVGHHLSFKGSTKKEQLVMRATRMLYTFHSYQDFEFRTPFIEKRKFTGLQGEHFEAFLSHLGENEEYSHSTVNSYRYFLHGFHLHLDCEQTILNDINTDIIEEYIDNHASFSLNDRRLFRSTVRNFLQYCYEKGVTDNNLSVLVLKSPKVRPPEEIPTTHSNEDIKKTLKVIDRSSAIGKRDYVIVLLASVYGMRASDIVSLTFSDIDWRNSMLRFPQMKTEEPLEYELIPEVGNAIIDYLKHGRPKTDCQNVIVSHNLVTKGKPLCTPTMHSVVTRYLSQVVPDWSEKKHGPHSLRFSMATTMLENKASLLEIKEVMGHRNIESTRIYTKVAIDQLRACAVPVAPVTSPYYRKGEYV